MSIFSSDIAFKYPWRNYQQRVLNDLVAHLNDDHLHIIAPPGSGKTVLGLEVMLRIGNGTLILAPTLAIRNQWIERFVELFVQTDQEPDWISRDIRNPKLLTVVTYQGLHAACHDNQAESIIIDFKHETDVVEKKKSNYFLLPQIVSNLKKVGIKTLILDEAHHLKNEWWLTLDQIKKELNPKIVGLTATPPYDVSPMEWMRYMAMNGPIDAEISVPELIKAGDLCPHQDFVYFSSLGTVEAEKIRHIRSQGKAFFNEIAQDQTLLQAIREHPFMLNPLEHDFQIHENLAFYSASLIFLSFHQQELDQQHFDLLGRPKEEGQLQLPELDYEWMEELLKQVLFDEKGYFAIKYKELQDTWQRKLRRAGILERKRIGFEKQKNILKYLSNSNAKLSSINQIVDFEFQTLGKELRQVILTDYVRKEYLDTITESNVELQKIGVVPIFEQLRRNNDNNKLLGVLTGTLVILPDSAMDTFNKLCLHMGRVVEYVQSTLPADANFQVIRVNDQNRDAIVLLVTKLFELGEIEILIGTKALLGEGWDAPSINSLILASVIGSFVSSNQMRGRAIRTNLKSPDKTSNIWHLATIDPTSSNGGAELDLIRRRFRNFVGISEQENGGIENGFSRLGIPEDMELHNSAEINKNTLALAKQRDRLSDKWKGAIQQGTQLIEEVKLPIFEPEQYNQVKSAQMQKTIRNMVATLTGSVALYMEWSTQAIANLSKFVGIHSSTAIMGMIGVGTVFFARRTFRTFKYYTLYRDISLDIYHIGNALTKTLVECKLFTTPIKDLKVLTYANNQGSVYCHLDGGTSFEKSMFVEMIQEIVDPIGNPRYIIIRKSKIFKIIHQLDFHAVPELLGKKAALANSFAKHWEKEVGKCELFFTRSIAGRRLLIRAKVKALANHLSDDSTVQHVHVWR